MTREEKIAILKALPKNSRVRYIGKNVYHSDNAKLILANNSIGFKVNNGMCRWGHTMRVIIGPNASRWRLLLIELTCTQIEVIEKLTGQKSTK